MIHRQNQDITESASQDEATDTAQQNQDITESASQDDATDTASHPLRALASRFLPLPLTAVSIALTVPYFRNTIFSYEVSGLSPLVGGLPLLVALALSSFMTIRQRSSLTIRLMVLPLFIIQFIYLIILTKDTIFISADPIVMLQVGLVGILGLTIALLVAVALLRGRSLTEPLAVGIISISFGAIFFPALRSATEPAQFPVVSGAALLFSTGSANQRLLMHVSIGSVNELGILSPGTDKPLREIVKIQNLANRKIHWTLLLVGGARLNFLPPIEEGHIKYLLLSAQSTFVPMSFGGNIQTIPIWAPAQLYSGTLSSMSSASINGFSLGNIVNITLGRFSFSLPDYGQGNLHQVDSQVRASIINALGGTPTIRSPRSFTVDVLGGHLQELQSIIQSSPAVAPNPSDSTKVEWISHSNILAAYAIGDQSQVNAASNLLWVLAILLAVAGAGLLASLQGIIHVFSMRERPDSHGGGSEG